MITVYTAVTGKEGGPSKVHTPEPGVRYLAFLEEGREAGEGWETAPLLPFSGGPYAARRNSRAPKILAHFYLPDTEYSIWIDAKLGIPTQTPSSIVEQMVEHDIYLTEHPWTKNLYQEAGEARRHAHGEPLDEQVAFYKAQEFPNGDYPLPTNMLIARRHTDRISQLNMAWWEQICRYSSRDQVSFCYVCWRLETTYGLLDFQVAR